MRINFALVLDHVSPLAMIAILAWVSGAIGPHRAGARVAPVALGIAFGLVAVLQMQSAFVPVDGVLVDLRAIPLALAGAYLGRGGLAACLAVALAGRAQIGGIGTGADLLAITLAGCAGFVWHRATCLTVPRGIGHFIILALAMSTSLVPALMLPQPLGQWFLGSAIPVIFPIYLGIVPLLAAILERERHLSLIEAGAAGGRDPPRAAGAQGPGAPPSALSRDRTTRLSDRRAR